MLYINKIELQYVCVCAQYFFCLGYVLFLWTYPRFPLFTITFILMFSYNILLLLPETFLQVLVRKRFRKKFFFTFPIALAFLYTVKKIVFSKHFKAT